LSHIFKLSGKNIQLPATSEMGWRFSVRPGGWIIAESSTGVRRRFMLHTHRTHLSTNLEGCPLSGELVANRRSSSSHSSGADLTAQFPGKVRKVLVQKGTSVKEGDPLVLVEAMKMEFAIRAPFASLVKEVLVKEGQQLSPGDQFVDLEAIEGAKD
jgi:biotin carboxyl carrier protein